MQAICGCCGEDCIARIVDNGIGITEAWGVRKNHVDKQVESDCCDADCFDEYGTLISLSDVQEYEDGARDYEDYFDERDL